MDERVEQAAETLSRILHASPLSREAWLQFIFEGDPTRSPPNFSVSHDGNVGMGASSHGGVLSMPGIPYIEIHCNPETLLRVVSGHLPLEEAVLSGRLNIEGGRDLAGGQPAGGRDRIVRASIIRELGRRFAGGTDMVAVEVTETLRFFDEIPDWADKQATAIVGMIGEDLNTACLQHYLESQGADVTVYPDSVTTGRPKGPRLDRWIGVDGVFGENVLFQTEIKNWSAHAISGEKLRIGAPSPEVREYKRRRWEGRWDAQRETLDHPSMAKVLIPMKLPTRMNIMKERTVKPLLLFWEPIGPYDSHLFKMDVSYDFPFYRPSNWPNDGTFTEFPALWIFSVSSYLRSLPSESKISLKMPTVIDRHDILGRLLPDMFA